jgi:uncharacterized protein YbaR (Trm112 family)
MADRCESQTAKLEELLLERLACPACFGALQLAADARITCLVCGRAYPLIDGIPVLIAERATTKS